MKRENVEQLGPLRQLYKDLPVSAQSIRLLRVDADSSSSAEDSPLRCELFVADLTTTPIYTALSYVWGQQRPTPDVIICNNVPIPVTENCYLALKHLRATNGSFFIWIDAICIDQNDDADKIQQIGLMGDIYSCAQTTFVWLGVGNDATDRAIDYMKRPGYLKYLFEDGDMSKPELHKSRYLPAIWPYLKGRWGFDISVVPHENAGEQPVCGPLTTADSSVNTPGSNITRWLSGMKLKKGECTTDDLALFFRCDWINRIWTYQEIILSSNPVVVCGYRHLPWAQLEHNAVLLASMYNIVRANGLRAWLEVVLTRATYRATDKRRQRNLSCLIAYSDFCLTLGKYHHRSEGLMRFVWGMGPFFIVAFSMFNAVERHASLLGRDGTAIFVGVFFVPCLLITVWGIPWIAPNPTYPRQERESRERAERFLQSDLHSRLLETLCGRSSTNPRDMSFGLSSILGGPRSNAVSPTVDYGLPQAKVFEQLTSYFIETANLLQVLILAGRFHCQGAPSWVPDYTRNFEITHRMIGYNRNRDNHFRSQDNDVTQGFKPYCYLQPGDEHILVVKGFTSESLLVVRPPRDESCSRYQKEYEGRLSEPSAWVKSASYEGAVETHNEILVGDRIALISGVPTPLIVRDDGPYVKVVAPLVLGFVPRKEGGSFQKIWQVYAARRKEVWMAEHSQAAQVGGVLEPDPSEYLEDLLIS